MSACVAQVRINVQGSEQVVFPRYRILPCFPYHMHVQTCKTITRIDYVHMYVVALILYTLTGIGIGSREQYMAIQN